MSNQIQLIGGFRLEEALASGEVKPGMLLEQTSAAAATVKAHSVEGGYAERMFAVEDALQGKTVDDAYATTTRVTFHVVNPGAVVNALIKAGSVVSIGEKLISAGDGSLIPNGDEDSLTTVAQIIAIAQEALDLSDSADVNTLATVRVL